MDVTSGYDRTSNLERFPSASLNTAPKTATERTAAHYQRNAATLLAKKREYRHANSKWATDTKYLSRDILVFDGEGVTVEGGKHVYVLFAAMSATDNVYHSIESVFGLGTVQIFDFILDITKRYPGAINSIYGGSYDFNMWLFPDFEYDDAVNVYEKQAMHWNGYRIAWRRGKSFYLGRDPQGEHVRKGNAREAGVTVYDVVSFFQTTFVNACDSYLGDRFAGRDRIVQNKRLRSSFTLNDLEDVKEYNKSELINLIELVKELRYRLNKVSLRPNRWDGPGAVAAALLKRERVQDAMKESPPEVAQAARYAYAGGRFEILRFGHVPNARAYEYDVNSAYPAALRSVPNLTRGTWVHNDGTRPVTAAFAVCHLRGVMNDAQLPGALFRRNANGTICYPMSVTGWYWSPEYAASLEYETAGYGTVTLLEAWEFVEDDPTDRPFHFIEPLYQKRRALKAAHDGAHVGIKLALNSLYGKLAQQVGWSESPKTGELRIPPFHQLEWAGYTTSYCRAKVLQAALSNMDSVIAFETDAVFTSEPLNVPISADLGAFEATTFASLTYLQSGMYFGTMEDGTEVNKTRGVDRGELKKRTVLQRLRKRNADERFAPADLTRFNGLGIALSQRFSKWCRWEKIAKRMRLEPTGKRVHVECPMCDETPIQFGVWHVTSCPYYDDVHSAEFPIEWINPDPLMQLDELREQTNEYED